jgi:acetyl esterase/lipase
MIHGGGHVMLSRKDIRPKQTKLLHEKGFLPVSVDYRLCPEINILDGPMTDVCDALSWVRSDLAQLVKRYGFTVDHKNVVIVGWSTGGHLAMTLAWTTKLRGVEPPQAILAFYCPTDYEDERWQKPNFPEDSEKYSHGDYDLLEAVHETPITAYNIPPNKASVGGWHNLSDPRSRLVLHFNWKGQMLPILMNGLPHKSRVSTSDAKKYYSMDQPSREKIVSISPFAQINRGTYQTPTYLVHGTADDLIPWQQTQRVHDALVKQGVPAGLSVVDNAVHLFDLYRDKTGQQWEVVKEGYEFLSKHITRT